MVRVVARYDYALVGALGAESDVAMRYVALVYTILAVEGQNSGFWRAGAFALAVSVQALIGHRSDGVFHPCSELRAVLEGSDDAGKVGCLLGLCDKKWAGGVGR